ncbi:flavin reductase family protein [Streptomyces sp. S.PNR 29]|uniref:flavin reductase family protein n=1 Tax=Streptomyces sp. S.PNR 29 TaxID=2973805 RepID=UPI0025B273BB|nr:flavin reductase family protein [Streptomyces sp. S.PNR 29]MDN0197957.1 flavin reductase family protein [Streptomyces sp. S.PNR 29]
MSPDPQPTPAAADAQAFKDAMALLAAPVSVVTGLDTAGRRWGFTASSVSSVSLDPPLVMVGIALTSSCHAAMAQAGEFVVNLLGEHHRSLAQRFATSGVDRFAQGGFGAWEGQAALPYLPDAKVLLRCRTVDVIRAGDHDLLLGTPQQIRIRDEAAPPLLWYQRQFHTPVPATATA